MHLKYIMPKADLQQTLNKLLEQDSDINQIQVKTELHDRNLSKLDISDIFNRDCFVPPTHCNWEGLTHFHLTIHRQQRGPLVTSSQEACFHLKGFACKWWPRITIQSWRLPRPICIHSIQNPPNGREPFKNVALKHQSILGSHHQIPNLKLENSNFPHGIFSPRYEFWWCLTNPLSTEKKRTRWIK